MNTVTRLKVGIYYVVPLYTHGVCVNSNVCFFFSVGMEIRNYTVLVFFNYNSLGENKIKINQTLMRIV